MTALIMFPMCINPVGLGAKRTTLAPSFRFLSITDSKIGLADGVLTDVAPTLLSYMDISIPETMNGKILIKD